MDWQDISTAPRDRPILGWAEDEENGWQIMTIKWVEAQPDPESQYVEHAAGWSGRIMYPGGDIENDEDYSPATFTITHWMPLPEPPGGEAANIMDRLARDQKPIGSDVEKILDDNLDKLYEI